MFCIFFVFFLVLDGERFKGKRMELRILLGDLRGCLGERRGDWYEGIVIEVVISGWI